MAHNTQYIAVVAPKYDLLPALVSAIVQVESGGNRFAHRVEPAYRWLWDVRLKRAYGVAEIDRASRTAPGDFPSPAGISATTEWIDQQSSWGLMQVMGAVAREQGFAGPMPGLSDPMVGLNHGCKLLARRRDQFLAQSGWAGVVAAYNAGSPRAATPGVFVNQSYVDAVRAAGGSDLVTLLA